MHPAFVVLASSTSSDSEAALESVTSPGQKQTSYFIVSILQGCLSFPLKNKLAIQLAFLVYYNKTKAI